ncbi:membrane protein insertase YidC [Agrilactobacillus fermenti]|uniref:membrane protein insertase YidC n=1 Tax=Agrilactobacillus fermenti TaxID=2586909 RepID=UPI001E3E0E3B|nr:membrane protein insertase YidC [Agrilactobacillus fermenti]MCD2257164.1 membrane protein insertase YidC [Agrilactobacillus fermenti]
MNKRQVKRIVLVLALALLVVVLAGCGNINTPVTKSSTGFWDRYIIYNFSRFIIWLAHAFNGSFGVAIIIFTLIIRIILLPLNHYQMKSMRKQMEIQPEMDALRKKYSAKDADTQRTLQEETQKLMSEAGVNPLMGCLPLVIQLPFMWALYQAIARTGALRHASFLWTELGSKDPYYILPILAAIFTFATSYLSSLSQPTQNSTTKLMTWGMPIFILFTTINFPAAITLYWVVSNAFQVGQTLLLQNPYKIIHEREAKEQAKRDREKALQKARKQAFKRKRK